MDKRDIALFETHSASAECVGPRTKHKVNTPCSEHNLDMTNAAAHTVNHDAPGAAA
jgi:hypothetical protein